MAKMKHTVTGTIVSGVLRGKPLIHKYRYRIVSVLGFEPYEGTLDVKLKFPLNIKPYATKRIEHMLLDGTMHIDAYIAPVTLTIHKHKELEEKEEKIDFSKKNLRERIDDLKRKQVILKERVKQMNNLLEEKEIVHETFAIQTEEPIDTSIVELIDKENLKEKFSLKDGDEIDITFYSSIKEKKISFLRRKK